MSHKKHHDTQVFDQQWICLLIPFSSGNNFYHQKGFKAPFPHLSRDKNADPTATKWNICGTEDLTAPPRTLLEIVKKNESSINIM